MKKVRTYKLPQEIEIFYIIPAIRKELTKNLLKQGLSKTEIASILGITKSAVSQYISSKRGNLKLSKKTKQNIKKSCKKIIKDKGVIIDEINNIVGFMKKSGEICEVCKKYNKNILRICGKTKR